MATEPQPDDSDAILRRLAGTILAAAQATGDERITKLGDEAMKLIAADMNAMKALLIQMAQEPEPRPSPFMQPPITRRQPKQQQQQPSRAEALKLAEQIVEQMKDGKQSNPTEARPINHAPAPAAEPVTT